MFTSVWQSWASSAVRGRKANISLFVTCQRFLTKLQKLHDIQDSRPKLFHPSKRRLIGPTSGKHGLLAKLPIQFPLPEMALLPLLAAAQAVPTDRYATLPKCNRINFNRFRIIHV